VERYLNRTIDSVLEQTVKNLEVILVNDGSTDGSGKIIDEYAKKDSRVKAVHQNNQGVSAARNAGIALAKGQYIGFVDSDDWVEENMYERLHSEAVKNNCDIVICDFSFEDINGQTIEDPGHQGGHQLKSNFLMEREDIKNDICRQFLTAGIFMSTCDKIYLRSFLEEHEITFIPGISLREDSFFNIDAFNFAERAIHISKPYYHYIDIPGSALKKYYKNAFEMSAKLYECKIKHAQYWNMDTREIRNKIACDFLSDVQDSVKNVFNNRNSDNFEKKVKRVSYIVNNPIVENSFIDYYCENTKNNKGKFEKLMIKLVNNKSVLLLSLLSSIDAKAPEKLKLRIKAYIK